MKNILLVMVLISGALTIIAYGEDRDVNREKPKDNKIEVKEIPHDLQLLTSITDTDLIPVKGYPTYFKPIPSGIFWPDKETIRRKKMDITDDFSCKNLTGSELVSEIERLYAWVSVKHAVGNTEYWVNKIIKPEWIPERITKFILPLKESYLTDIIRPRKEDSEHGILCDAIWLRYEIKDRYYIQIISTSQDVIVFIKPCIKERVKKPDDEHGIKTFIKENIEAFLLESDKVKEIFDMPKKGTIGWRGTPNYEKVLAVEKGIKENETKKGVSYLWSTINWWTDGEIVMFKILKDDTFEGEKGIDLPTHLCKHWFSSPLRSEDNKEHKDKEDKQKHDSDQPGHKDSPEDKNEHNK